jgi:L-cystine transport system permease protein
VLTLTLLLGAGVAVARTYRVKVLSQILDFYVIVFKAIPVNLALVTSALAFTAKFNSIAEFFHLSIRVKDVNMLYVGVFAVTLLSIATMSEYIRGALLSVSKNQYEAGYMVGMTFFQTFRRIVLPQLFLVLLPSLTGFIIATVKGSSLLILINVFDILNGALSEAHIAFTYFEAYFAAALIYWTISLLIQYLGNVSEKRLGRYRREIT